MKSKTVISALVIIVGIGGLFWWGKSAQSGTAVKSASDINLSSLTAAGTAYDFGNISMKDGLVEKTFEIANLGNQDIKLERITTSCMCTSAYISTLEGEKGPFGMVGHESAPKINEIIRSGETRKLRVVFDPNAHGPAGIGIISRIVTLQESSGNKLDFQIKAVVTP